MLHRFITSALLLLVTQMLYANITIVTTVAPIASIYKAIAQDRASVTTLQSNTHACVHHMHITPSQITAARNADMFIYIDDAFEAHVSKIINHANVHAHTFKISTIKNLHLKTRNNVINWHLWLDISNIRLIGNAALEQLSALSPDHRNYFVKNHKQFSQILNVIADKLHAIIKHKTAYLSSNLDYLLSSINVPFLDLDLAIASNCIKLRNVVKQNHYTSLLIDDHDIWSKKLLDLLPPDIRITTINVENWHYANETGSNSLLDNWNKIIGILQK